MVSDPLVLAFDSSGPWIGAVLLRGGQVLADQHEEMPKGQAEALFPLLEDILARGGAGWPDLSAIGVGVGPGNFTGIRISVSAARGLALALEIPAVGVSLFEAVAWSQTGPILSALSAPRDQVYIQGFGTRHAVAPQLVPLDSLGPELAEPGLTCVGPAAEAVARRIGASVGHAQFAPASAIARIAAQRSTTAPEPPAPLYLKPADAAPSRDAPPVILDDA